MGNEKDGKRVMISFMLFDNIQFSLNFMGLNLNSLNLHLLFQDLTSLNKANKPSHQISKPSKTFLYSK